MFPGEIWSRKDLGFFFLFHADSLHSLAQVVVQSDDLFKALRGWGLVVLKVEHHFSCQMIKTKAFCAHLTSKIFTYKVRMKVAFFFFHTIPLFFLASVFKGD